MGAWQGQGHGTLPSDGLRRVGDEGVGLLRSWAGLYSITPDMLAVLGETALSGLFAALSGAKGFMTAPAAGRLLAHVVDGQAVPDWFARLSPARFASGEELETEPAIV